MLPRFTERRRPGSRSAKIWNILEYALKLPVMVTVSDRPAIIEFGRFRIVPHCRQLLADGRPISLGGRTFDLLTALIEASGAVVSKDELLSRIWPDRIVEENRLQGEISALRKAFGADRDLIQTVAGRGYQFTGQILTRSAVAGAQEISGTVRAAAGPPRPPTNLPEPISQLVGREVELSEVTDLVTTHRLVTLTGEGGIGKTRLGVEIARQLLSEFADGVWVAELAPLSDPDLVAVTVATSLGLELSEGAMSSEGVANALGAKQLLLVLDNCEHVIDAAASMAGALLRTNSGVRVLATSREPLRTEGERLYRVPPLAVPAEDMEDTEELLRHGAGSAVCRAGAVGGPALLSRRPHCSVRTALDWAFSLSGDAAIGVALTLTAVPLWSQLSLMEECRGRVERALTIEHSSGRDPRSEMLLYAALAASLIQMKGPVAETGRAWGSVLELVESLYDTEYQLRSLWGLCVYRFNSGEHCTALTLAQKFCGLAAMRAGPAEMLIGDRITGLVLHLLGDQTTARRHIERVLAGYVGPVHRSHALRLSHTLRYPIGYDQRYRSFSAPLLTSSAGPAPTFITRHFSALWQIVWLKRAKSPKDWWRSKRRSPYPSAPKSVGVPPSYCASKASFC
jgi:DNA-binding winged helix-turn-helix (wHTH) protein